MQLDRKGSTERVLTKAGAYTILGTMLRKSLILALWVTVAAFSVQACSSPRGKASTDVFSTSSAAANPEIFKKLEDQAKDYKNITDYCESQLNSIRRDQKGISYWLIGIAVLGAALGAGGSALLAASAANTATAAFFSAGAGVAAGVQPTMTKEGETPEYYRATYKALNDIIQADVKAWNDVTRDGTQQQVVDQQKVLEMRDAHCRFIPYPATAPAS